MKNAFEITIEVLNKELHNANLEVEKLKEILENKTKEYKTELCYQAIKREELQKKLEKELSNKDNIIFKLENKIKSLSSKINN